MAENDDERSKKIAKVIARAWTDDEFKKKLKTEPETTLRKAGIKVPSGMKVKVHENSGKVIHWVLPAKPAGVAKKDLASVASRKRLHIDACCSG
jgi:hypothetical protein